jgi:RNA polymerase sigma factor (TIGR02999 family)
MQTPEGTPTFGTSELRRLAIEHYDELHDVAARHMGAEGNGQTLQTTALLHEALGQLLDPARHVVIRDTGHFLATMRLAMKHILIDRARQKQTEKAGGQLRRQRLSSDVAEPGSGRNTLLALADSIEKLASEDSLAARLVSLRSQGFSVEEAAQELGLSRTAAYNLWSFTRAWLVSSLTRDDSAHRLG